MRRLRCRLMGWLETVQYVVNGGVLGWSVSGHRFGEPSWAVEGDREVETLVCERCGTVSRGWRPM